MQGLGVMGAQWIVALSLSPPLPSSTSQPWDGAWGKGRVRRGRRGRESFCTWCMCFFNVNDEKICYGTKVFNKPLELVKFEHKWRSGTTSKIQHQWPIAWNSKSHHKLRIYTQFSFTSTIFTPMFNSVIFIALPPPTPGWVLGTGVRSLDSMT